jgi:hypothetical protein
VKGKAMKAVNGNHFLIPDNPAFDFAASFSITMWLKKLPGGAHVLFMKGRDVAGGTFGLNTTDFSVRYSYSTASAVNVQLVENEWHMYSFPDSWSSETLQRWCIGANISNASICIQQQFSDCFWKTLYRPNWWWV